MTTRYTLREPKVGGYEPPDELKIHGNLGISPHIILRLFNGSLNVFDKTSQKMVILNWDETKQIKSNRSAKPHKIVATLFDETDGISVDDYKAFLVKHSNLNVKFFETFLLELTHCIVAKKNKNYLESFLHLYRILEYISLAFPTIYSRSQRDFEKAHAFHKSLFKGDRDADLIALKSFVEVIADSGGLTELDYVLNYGNLGATEGKAAVRELKATLKKSISQDCFDEDNIQITVKFCQFSPLIVDIRNRLFHFSHGERNINVCKIGGTDSLLAPLMDLSLNWLFQVYAEIIRVIARDYIAINS